MVLAEAGLDGVGQAKAIRAFALARAGARRPSHVNVG